MSKGLNPADRCQTRVRQGAAGTKSKIFQVVGAAPTALS